MCPSAGGSDRELFNLLCHLCCVIRDLNDICMSGLVNQRKVVWSDALESFRKINSINPTGQVRWPPTWSQGLTEVSAFLKELFHCHCRVVLVCGNVGSLFLTVLHRPVLYIKWHDTTFDVNLCKINNTELKQESFLM